MIRETAFAVMLAAVAGSGAMGCADGDEDMIVGGDDEAIPTAEADLTASAPKLTNNGGGLTATGFPLLIGLKAPTNGAGQPTGPARRELVFLNTSIPDGPDLAGHPRFNKVTFEKRVVHLSFPTQDDPEAGPFVVTPAGGVASGTSLLSQAPDGTGGSVQNAVMERANTELKQLWSGHPTGRFTVKMFPARNGTVHTANGFDVSIVDHSGIITAQNGIMGSYDAGTEFATLEQFTEVVGGQKRISTCQYNVALKDAAVLENVARVAVFHVERTLKKKTGDKAVCMKSEDKYVLGLFGI